MIDTIVTTTKRMHISHPSDRSATGFNNTRVMKKQIGIDSFMENLQASKEFNISMFQMQLS